MSTEETKTKRVRFGEATTILVPPRTPAQDAAPERKCPRAPLRVNKRVFHTINATSFIKVPIAVRIALDEVVPGAQTIAVVTTDAADTFKGCVQIPIVQLGLCAKYMAACAGVDYIVRLMFESPTAERSTAGVPDRSHLWLRRGVIMQAPAFRQDSLRVVRHWLEEYITRSRDTVLTADEHLQLLAVFNYAAENL